MASRQKPRARARGTTRAKVARTAARRATGRAASRKAPTKAAKKAPKRATNRQIAKRAPAKAMKRAPKKTAPKAAGTVRKATKKPAARKVTRPAARATAKTVRDRKPLKKTVPKTTVKKAPKKAPKKALKKAPARPAPARRRASALPAAPRLQRERKRLPEAELEDFLATGADDRMLLAARAGHDELRSELRKHTEEGLVLTAGDVDARWQDAYAIGDEAPGGDSPTPDQDRVDDIGRALGVVYDDDEELMGGDEIAERDAHRWELDPASREDDET